MLRKLFPFSSNKATAEAKVHDEPQFDDTFDTFVPAPPEQAVVKRVTGVEAAGDYFETWMAQLPADVRPYSLAARFEHIARKIALLWSDEDSLFKYMSGLLVDQRGGRQGFPPHVALELMRLDRYIYERFPGRDQFEKNKPGYTAQDWFAGRPPRT